MDTFMALIRSIPSDSCFSKGSDWLTRLQCAVTMNIRVGTHTPTTLFSIQQTYTEDAAINHVFIDEDTEAHGR